MLFAYPFSIYRFEMINLVYFKDDLSWVAVNKSHPNVRVLECNEIEVDYGPRGCFVGRVIGSFGEFVTNLKVLMPTGT